MTPKKRFSIAFLKNHNPNYTEKDFSKFLKQTWRNIREENPSLRLTKNGYQFLKKTLKLKDYMVKLKRECKLKPEILLGLDKFITCPYYITNKEIYVFEEKLATELVLRAGDLDILIVSRR
jgi:hypothetical protein|tara:strand:- start:75 stop:437 length:363 start_codon:yes stop_codon:yes gene_type:complete